MLVVRGSRQKTSTNHGELEQAVTAAPPQLLAKTCAYLLFISFFIYTFFVSFVYLCIFLFSFSYYAVFVRVFHHFYHICGVSYAYRDAGISENPSYKTPHVHLLRFIIQNLLTLRL